MHEPTPTQAFDVLMAVGDLALSRAGDLWLWMRSPNPGGPGYVFFGPIEGFEAYRLPPAHRPGLAQLQAAWESTKPSRETHATNL